MLSFPQYKSFVLKLMICLFLTSPIGLLNSSNNNLQAAEKTQYERGDFRLGRVMWNYSLADDMANKYREMTNTHGEIKFASQTHPFRDFVDGQFDVLLRGGTVYGPLSPYDKKLLTKNFGSPKKIRSYIIGHTVIYVVVHKRNRIKSLTLKQLKGIYRFRRPLTDWKQLGDGKKSGPIVWFMPPRGWFSSYVMRLKGMSGRMFGSRATVP